MFANNPVDRQPARAVGAFLVAARQRNPTPLFGLGLIDAIPDAAIEQMENAKRPGPRRRPRDASAALKDGRIGRLGWKGQTANTEDFVLNACAVELGLEVPGHHAGHDPAGPEVSLAGPRPDRRRVRRAGRLRAEPARCRPSVGRRRPRRPSTSRAAGRPSPASAARTATRPRSATSQGIYSDLLLHDMGQEMGDDGSYDRRSQRSDDESRWSPGSQPTGRGRQGQPSRPQRRARADGRHRAGMADAAARGASATRARISTTAAPRPWSRPSRCTAARARPRRIGSSGSRRASGSRSRRSSSRSSPHPLSGSLATATESAMKLKSSAMRARRLLSQDTAWCSHRALVIPTTHRLTEGGSKDAT